MTFLLWRQNSIYRSTHTNQKSKEILVKGSLVSLIFSCSSLLMTWAGFMGLLPRGLGPDLLWLKERLDAASTFIGQIKLKLLPVTSTPLASAPCTFILINEAIPVINGSYYTRLYRTFSFDHGAVSEWVKCILILGWTHLSSLSDAKPCLSHFIYISWKSQFTLKLCCLT